MPRFFNSTLLVQPQAAVQIIDDGLSGPSVGGSGDLCILGVAGGGQPFTPLFFSTPQDAANVLLSGDGLRACLRAFAPGPNVPGAPRIVFIRVNNAIQSTGTLPHGAGVSVNLKSRDWGAANNTIKVAVAPATTTNGFRKLIVYKQGSQVVIDEVGRLGFKVTTTSTNSPVLALGQVSTAPGTTTTGALTTASTTVPVTDGSKFTTATTHVIIDAQGTGLAEVVPVTITTNPPSGAATINLASPPTQAHASGVAIAPYNGEIGIAVNSSLASECAIFSFSTYQTIQSLVDAFNSHASGVYTAAYLAPVVGDLSTVLDAVAGGTAIPNGGSYLTLASHLYQVLNRLNDNSQPWVSATAAATPGFPPDIDSSSTSTVWHQLSGASDGNVPPLTADWQSGLNAAATIDCSVICVATGDAVVHAMLAAHVDVEASPEERHERIALIGGVSGESLTQVIARASALRDPRIGLAWPGIYDVDATQAQNGVILLDPWLVAAQLGGMFCGSEIQDSLTNRYIRAQGVEVKLGNSDRDTALLQGIIPILYVPNKGYRVSHSQSTWIADQNFRRNELSTMRASDFLAKTVREALDDLVGRIVSPSLGLLVGNVTESVLTNLWNQGIIVGDRTNPAFRKVQVTLNGDTVTVSFEANIAVPANYILVQASLTPFTETLSF